MDSIRSAWRSFHEIQFGISHAEGFQGVAGLVVYLDVFKGDVLCVGDFHPLLRGDGNVF